MKTTATVAYTRSDGTTQKAEVPFEADRDPRGVSQSEFKSIVSNAELPPSVFVERITIGGRDFNERYADIRGANDMAARWVRIDDRNIVTSGPFRGVGVAPYPPSVADSSEGLQRMPGVGLFSPSSYPFRDSHLLRPFFSGGALRGTTTLNLFSTPYGRVFGLDVPLRSGQVFGNPPPAPIPATTFTAADMNSLTTDVGTPLGDAIFDRLTRLDREGMLLPMDPECRSTDLLFRVQRYSEDGSDGYWITAGYLSARRDGPEQRDWKGFFLSSESGRLDFDWFEKNSGPGLFLAEEQVAAFEGMFEGSLNTGESQTRTQRDEI